MRSARTASLNRLTFLPPRFLRRAISLVGNAYYKSRLRVDATDWRKPCSRQETSHPSFCMYNKFSTYPLNLAFGFDHRHFWHDFGENDYAFPVDFFLFKDGFKPGFYFAPGFDLG